MVCEFLAITRNDNKFHVCSIVQRRELPSKCLCAETAYSQQDNTTECFQELNPHHAATVSNNVRNRVPHPPATACNTGRKSLQSLDTVIRVYIYIYIYIYIYTRIQFKFETSSYHKHANKFWDHLSIKFFVSQSFGSYDLQCNIC